MASHEHQWGSGKAQQLDLPARWYWIKGCECGAILMEPVPEDMHILLQQIAVMDKNRTFQSLINRG